MTKRSFSISIIGTMLAETTIRIKARNLDEALKKFSALTAKDIKALKWQTDLSDIDGFLSVLDSTQDLAVDRPWSRYNLRSEMTF